jgi:hypothetical protein
MECMSESLNPPSLASSSDVQKSRRSLQYLRYDLKAASRLTRPHLGRDPHQQGSTSPSLLPG